MTDLPAAGDPADAPPIPPREPESGECCQSGCDPCVYDLYWEAVERYDRELAAWRARHDPVAKP